MEAEGLVTMEEVREAGLRGNTWSVYSLGGGMMGTWPLDTLTPDSDPGLGNSGSVDRDS